MTREGNKINWIPPGEEPWIARKRKELETALDKAPQEGKKLARLTLLTFLYKEGYGLEPKDRQEMQALERELKARIPTKEIEPKKSRFSVEAFVAEEKKTAEELMKLKFPEAFAPENAEGDPAKEIARLRAKFNHGLTLEEREKLERLEREHGKLKNAARDSNAGEPIKWEKRREGTISIRTTSYVTRDGRKIAIVKKAAPLVGKVARYSITTPEGKQEHVLVKTEKKGNKAKAIVLRREGELPKQVRGMWDAAKKITQKRSKGILYAIAPKLFSKQEEGQKSTVQERRVGGKLATRKSKLSPHDLKRKREKHEQRRH